MARWVVRSAGTLVVGVLVLAACGGGGGAGVKLADATVPGSTAPDRPDVPALLEGGLVSDAALSAMVGADGSPNTAVLAVYANELMALPVAGREAAMADLSMRVELEVATMSGLEAAVGDRASTEAALTGAWSQVRTQSDAAAATARDSSGLRSGLTSASAASPSAGTIATVGLFMGYMGLSVMTQVGTERSNTFKAGETDVHEGDGVTLGGSVDEVNTEMTYTGEEKGVHVEFLAASAVHPCPEPDGSFSIDAVIDVKANKDGVGQNAKMELKITGTVDDNAELASKNIENHVQWSDFGGGKGQFLDFTYSGPNGLESFTANRTGGTVTDEFQKLAISFGSLIAVMVATPMIDTAQKAWKSGRCVQLNVTPSAGPSGLEPSQVVSVLAEPRSKVDGKPTGGMVTATLSAGGASVEPNGSPIPADATSNYTAPNEQDKTGTVSYESRSRRGIGKADLTFTTSKPAAYLIVGGLEDWQVNEVVCDITKPFTLTSPGVGVAQFSGGLSGTYSASGVFNFHYEGTYEISLSNGLGSPGSMIGSSGGSIAGQAGSGSENYSLTPATC